VAINTIDSHMHANFNGLSIRDIIKYLDREKIDCCWLLTWEEVSPGLWPYQHLSVEDVYEAYLKHPSRIIPFYAQDPHNSHAAVQLENWCKKGVCGCGELKATLNWDSDGVKSILQTARRLKLPIVFHMEESECRPIPYSDSIYDKLIYYGLKTERKIYRVPRRILQILFNSFAPLRNRTKSYIFPGYMLHFASLETALRDYPDVNMIAHGPMFWKYISGDASEQIEVSPGGQVHGEGIIWRLLREHRNFYADISGFSGLNALTRDPQNAKKFLTVFEGKILYGTDNVIKKQREFLNSLGLSKSTYKKIYGENACRILNI
jgi:predicted TIM-barrel fold metal-dependent hydrolase